MEQYAFNARVPAMTGLLFLIVAAAWLWVVIWVAKKMGALLPEGRGSKAAQILFGALLLPLPLIDEVVGGVQFAELCKKNIVHMNAESLRGRTVYLDYASQTPVKGTWVRVWAYPQRFVDATSGEVVLSYDHLRAEGGALFPGFDSGHDPLLFKGECKPPGVFEKTFLSELGVTRIKNPKPDPFVLK